MQSVDIKFWCSGRPSDGDDQGAQDGQGAHAAKERGMPPDIATAEQVSALGALVIFSASSFLLTGGAFLCLQQAFLSKRRAMEPR